MPSSSSRALNLRIRHKIILAMSIAITISMLISDGLQGWMQERAALKEREYALTVLTNSIAEGIEAIMMTGSTEATISFTKHFKEIPYITGFKIIRYDGKEAFFDNKTIDQVNMTLEEDRYPRRTIETHVQALPANDERLVHALDTNQIISYYDGLDSGERTLTFLAPIKTSEECRDCHASKRTRGVIQLTTSLSAIDDDLNTSRKHSLLALAGTLLVTILIAAYLLKRSVTGPLEQLMDGMRRISQGDLEHSVQIERRDELGEMARIFNEMTTEIRQTHAGLRREQDKLTTIIHGANEGIVITDGLGNVVLVNPSAEALLGKTASQITENGFLMLFDDVDEMQKWLKMRTSRENIIKVFNNRLFQVYVSMIQDAQGLPIGSAALIRDVTEEKRLEDELRRLSTTDPLTGLFNRRHMDYALTTEFSRASRTGAPFSVMMFDIDHFKKFNDTYGHDQGDRVLQAVAKSFQDSLRKYDIACRYGGEEFIAILPSTNMEGALSVAERVRRDVENLEVEGLKVTISLGVASYPEIMVPSGEPLVEAADKALYCSKHNGRNRVTRAEPTSS